MSGILPEKKASSIIQIPLTILIPGILIHEPRQRTNHPTPALPLALGEPPEASFLLKAVVLGYRRGGLVCDHRLRPGKKL